MSIVINHWLKHHLSRVMGPYKKPNYPTSTDQKIPSTAAAIAKPNQVTLEALRHLPVSKMYWTPCRELAWVYSIMVSFKASYIVIYIIFHMCNIILMLIMPRRISWVLRYHHTPPGSDPPFVPHTPPYPCLPSWLPRLAGTSTWQGSVPNLAVLDKAQSSYETECSTFCSRLSCNPPHLLD